MTDATTPGTDAKAPTAPKPGRAAFAFIFVTVLLDMIALGIVVPVLPKLIKSFLNGDTADAAHIVGYFGAAWALMQFIFQPIVGAASDRFGRRPVIILSNFGLGLDYILMALSPNLWFLFAGRLISGVTAASVSTAYAYVADVAPPEKARGTLWHAGRGLRAGLHRRAGADRGFGRYQYPGALLGCGGIEPGQCGLWLSRVAGILVARKAGTLFLASGQSDRLAAPAELESEADASCHGRPAAAFRPWFAAQHVRSLCRLPLWLEPDDGQLGVGRRGRRANDRFGRAGTAGDQAPGRTGHDDVRDGQRASSASGSMRLRPTAQFSCWLFRRSRFGGWPIPRSKAWRPASSAHRTRGSCRAPNPAWAAWPIWWGR